MLYTIVPLEEVLEGIEQEPAQVVDVVVNGVLLQVEPLGNFSGRVKRVISSDPQTYLNKGFQPDSILRWT
jgi:hypothetical protein